MTIGIPATTPISLVPNSTVGTSVKPCVSLQTALNKANAGHGPGLELILVAGSNHGAGGVYHETVHYSGAYNGVLIRRTVGAVKVGPGADLDSIIPEKDFEHETNLAPAIKIHSPEPLPDFDENTILPGQKVPFGQIGNAEKLK